jgi:hypothetical protein
LRFLPVVSTECLVWNLPFKSVEFPSALLHCCCCRKC